MAIKRNSEIKVSVIDAPAQTQEKRTESLVINIESHAPEFMVTCGKNIKIAIRPDSSFRTLTTSDSKFYLTDNNGKCYKLLDCKPSQTHFSLAHDIIDQIREIQENMKHGDYIYYYHAPSDSDRVEFGPFRPKHGDIVKVKIHSDTIAAMYLSQGLPENGEQSFCYVRFPYSEETESINLNSVFPPSFDNVIEWVKNAGIVIN